MATYIIAWPTLGVAILVFGFAPGAVLRLTTLLYPQSSPRRKEMMGELYAVPRIERPFWVAEQFEMALFEGLRCRLTAWHAKRSLEQKRSRNRRIVRVQGYVRKDGVRVLAHTRSYDFAAEAIKASLTEGRRDRLFNSVLQMRRSVEPRSPLRLAALLVRRMDGG